MKNKKIQDLIKVLIKDFRVWVLVYFLIRLIGVLNPPLEVAHNWRQVTVNMVARNYLEIDANLFYPRVDMAGEKTGITGMEFPLLNYLIFIVSKLFGFNHWYGRLINLIVSSIGTYYFYLIVKKQFSPELAFLSGVIFLNSIWFCYSRKIMPDTFSVSLAFIGLYYALEYLYIKNNILNLFLYGLFGMLGILSKIPAAVILTPLLIPIFDKLVGSKRKLFLITVSIIILIPVIAWYFYWVPYLVTEYGFWHYYMGTSFSNGFHEIILHLDEFAKKFYFEALKFVGFFLFVLGIIFLIRKPVKKLSLVVIITTVIFMFFVIIAGRGFYHHSYYIIPYVPVMALVAAFALCNFKLKWIRNGLLVVVIVEGTLNQYHDFRIKKEDSYRLTLEKIADSISEPQDLIVINGDENPRDLYFTHRKGWTISNKELFNIDYLNELASKGCKYIFIDKKASEYQLPELPFVNVYEDKSYSIYKF
jgi:hypothetical protein